MIRQVYQSKTSPGHVKAVRLIHGIDHIQTSTLADERTYLDLSARLIDLMRSAAQLAEDPLLLATVA